MSFRHSLGSPRGDQSLHPTANLWWLMVAVMSVVAVIEVLCFRRGSKLRLSCQGQRVVHVHLSVFKFRAFYIYLDPAIPEAMVLMFLLVSSRCVLGKEGVPFHPRSLGPWMVYQRSTLGRRACLRGPSPRNLWHQRGLAACLLQKSEHGKKSLAIH